MFADRVAEVRQTRALRPEMVAEAGWRKALRLPNVLGLVAGRSLLYPADDDVAGAVDTSVSLL